MQIPTLSVGTRFHTSLETTQVSDYRILRSGIVLLSSIAALHEIIKLLN